jgi:hypothetical protein
LDDGDEIAATSKIGDQGDDAEDIDAQVSSDATEISSTDATDNATDEAIDNTEENTPEA